LHTVLMVYVLTARMAFPSVDLAPTGSEPVAPPPISAKRTVNFDLFSDRKAPRGSWARVTVPETLNKQGFVEMGIISEGLPDDAEVASQPAQTRHVTRSYWGSSETPADGQPLAVTQTGSTQVSRLDVPTGTYAYWPAFDNEKMPTEPRIAGPYTLETSFCGTVSMRIEPDQDFLSPIELTGMPNNADLDKPIRVSWLGIPGALGYVVSAFAGKANESVEWTAGNDLKLAARVETQAYVPETVKELIKSGALLSPDTLSCTIPAGIFAGHNSVMLTIHAIGKDQILRNDEIEVRTVVRSSATIPIYVKPNPALWGSPDAN